MPNQVSNSVRLILKPFLFDYKNKWLHFRLTIPLFQVCHARFSVFMTARIMNSIGCFGKSIQTIFHGKGWLCNATQWRCTATLAYEKQSIGIFHYHQSERIFIPVFIKWMESVADRLPIVGRILLDGIHAYLVFGVLRYFQI